MNWISKTKNNIVNKIKNAKINASSVKLYNQFIDFNNDYDTLFGSNIEKNMKIISSNEMDEGRLFLDNYADAYLDLENLQKNIYKIDNVKVLGTGIHSRWYYLKQQPYNLSEILKEENRLWFIVALERIIDITEEKDYYINEIKSISVISKNEENINEKITQELDINFDGKVNIKEYRCDNKNNSICKPIETKVTISKEKVDEIFKILNYFGKVTKNEYYRNRYDSNWIMNITDKKGKKEKIRGTIYKNFFWRVEDASKIIRKILGIDNLLLFDNNIENEKISKITLEYNKQKRLKRIIDEYEDYDEEDEEDYYDEGYEIFWDEETEVLVDDGEEEEAIYDTFERKEKLILDAKNNVLEYSIRNFEGWDKTIRYQNEKIISDILNQFNPKTLFANGQKNNKTKEEFLNEKKEYTITIEYEKRPNRVISGGFYKSELPKEYHEFINFVYMNIYWKKGEIEKDAEIFDKSIYKKEKYTEADYIYCGVSFNQGYKVYNYITDDLSIEVGDYIVVPVGRDNKKHILRVLTLDYFKRENVPFPIHKTKKVICKYKGKRVKSDI